MKMEIFLIRLDKGKVNNLTYERSGVQGLACIWKHQSDYFVTIEECQPGEQYNESLYTRDERHVFTEAQQAIDYLKSQELEPTDFTD